ncbi:MAG TPA: ABC transporter permease [Candidatus Acidoferrales bacterium]|nr:ABC transporter permease [Candidatus Acidoferrales bacterium]
MLSRLRVWASRIRGLFAGHRLDEDFQRELASHLDLLTEENIRRGLPPAEARRQARLRLGGAAQLRETQHDLRGLPWLETLFQDVRFGLRMLRKNPGFTAVAVVTLALGIGANTAIFSMVNGFLLTPLPVAHPGEIVALAVQEKDTPLGTSGLSYPEFVDFRSQTDAFSGAFANVLSTATLRENSRADQLSLSYVSADFFTVLGLKPAVGRLILPSDEESFGQPSLLVLGYSFWQKRFGGDPNVVGTRVRMNGKVAAIIGVGPRNFHGMFSPFEIDAYLPLGVLASEDPSSRFVVDRGQRRILAFGRLKPNVTLREAQNSLDVISSRLAQQYPATDGGVRIRAIPERLARPQPYANNAFIVIGALFLAFGGLVLLLACMNVTNVVLARALVRRREMALRAALGAIRGRLIRQMLTETVLLALLGGMAGLILAALAIRLAPSIHLANFPLRFDFHFDWRVYAYALAAAVVSGIVAGLPPALRASRADVNATLRDEGLSRGGKHRLHSDLVIAQIACSLMLLIMAGMFLSSLDHIEKTYLGFDADNVVNLTVDPSEGGYDRARTITFYRELEDRIQALPGVQSASLAENVPIGSFPARMPVLATPLPLNPSQQPPSILYNAIDSGYFSTMRVPILRGRSFVEADSDAAPPVAIVNETMARKFWPHEDPLGRVFRLRNASGPLVEIVGVARDGKYQTIAEDFQPYFYVPLAQHYISRRVLEIRTRVRPEALMPLVQREMHAIAPDVSIIDLRTMKQSLETGTGYFIFRLGASLAGQLGILGLLLAVVGVYGVVSFLVTQRTREIGIRATLGANPRAIVWLVMRQGAALIITGVLAGLVASFALAHAVGHLLVGVSSTDPAIYGAAAAILSCAAFLACYIPARRATRVDPMVALRHE